MWFTWVILTTNSNKTFDVLHLRRLVQYSLDINQVVCVSRIISCHTVLSETPSIYA